MIDSKNSTTTENRKRGQKIPPSEIDKIIGMNIRIARNMSGKRQEDLSNYLGITLQQMQKYENGKNKISANILVKVAQYFNIPISYFIPNNLENNNALSSLNTYAIQQKVAENWQPIGSSKSENHIKEKEKQEFLLKIIEILTEIHDVDKQQKIIKILEELKK